MALFKSFLKDKSKGNSAPVLQGDKITLDILKTLIPIRNLDEEKLEAFAEEKYCEKIKAGETLFTVGDQTDSAIYLLKGVVSITDKNGSGYEVDSSSTEARFPLCSGNIHNTSAVAKTDLCVLRVSHKIMSINSGKLHNELIIPETLQNNRLLQLFSQYITEEKLEVPVLPQVAIRLREAMQQDIGIADAVKIIQADPVVSAKLIEVANCPLYLTLNPARTCLDAVNRIGLKATRNLVISFSLKQIFKSSSKDIRKMLDHIWKESLMLSCLSYVLASESTQYSSEEALLAGLVSDIGSIPFLNFAANLPREFFNPDEIRQALPAIKPVIGATILKEWNFDEEFVEAARHSNDWFYQHDGDINVTDIVILSRLHYKLGKKRIAHLPPISSIPATSKLKDFALSPENTLHILHNAQHKIKDTLSMFVG